MNTVEILRENISHGLEPVMGTDGIFYRRRKNRVRIEKIKRIFNEKV